MQSSKIALVATAVLAATSSWAFVDAPISGKRLVMRDTPTPKIVFVSKAAVPGPTVTGSDDPTFFGATLTVISMGGETASIDLPASGWTASGGVFRFRNTLAPSGISPVRTATIVPGRRLKIFSRTPGISMDEPSQGSITLVLDSGTLRYCAAFGGAVTRDQPGKFNAKDAPAPVACPPRPTTTTTSTTSTSTSTSSTSPVPTTTSSSVTSTTSTTTLAPGCPPPAVPMGGIEFTIGAGTPSCGGPAFVPASPGPFSGTLEDSGTNTIASLAENCLYVGGGLSNSLPPAHIPDGAVSQLSVSGANGLALTLAASDGNGPIDCTRGAGPLSHCANGAPGTDSNGLCTSEADCGGGTGNCVLDANCFFGPPIPLPSLVPATSSCVVNAIGTDACGAADLAANTSSLSVVLLSRLYLTSNQAEPCPRCVSGTCTAGKRAGLGCSGGIGSQLTTNECPPSDNQYVGQLVVNPLQLSSGTSVRTDPGGIFCPNQTTFGAFGRATTRTIRQAGVSLGGGPTLLSTRLAGIFCVPSSASPLIDNAEDIPGPASVSVPGTLSLCLGILCL
jgi:hypothetical protein